MGQWKHLRCREIANELAGATVPIYIHSHEVRRVLEAAQAVPCDEAAIERATRRYREIQDDATDDEMAAALERGDWAEAVAREMFRAAGETQANLEREGDVPSRPAPELDVLRGCPDAGRRRDTMSNPGSLHRLTSTLMTMTVADTCPCGGARGHAGWLLCALRESGAPDLNPTPAQKETNDG